MATTLDFGLIDLSEALSRSEDLTGSITTLEDYLANPSEFTRSGREIKSVANSSAKFTGKYMPMAEGIEGETVKNTAKRLMGMKNEQAILDAIIAAKTPVVSPGEIPSPTIKSPKVPLGLAKLLSKALTGLDLLTYSGDLNSNEKSELAARRAKPPTTE